MQDIENWDGVTANKTPNMQQDVRNISAMSNNIDNLMTTLLDYAEISNRILNQIDDLVNETATYFACESGDKFRDQYSLLKTGHAIINKNILSYNTDLINAKNNYQERTEVGVDILNAGINEVEQKFV